MKVSFERATFILLENVTACNERNIRIRVTRARLHAVTFVNNVTHMPVKIITRLNEVVNDDWVAADANDNSFLGIQINQNDRGVEIYGIEFGARGAVTDEDFLRTSCIIAESYLLDASLSSIINRARMRNNVVRFWDLPTNAEKTRIHILTAPIKIEAGKSFAIMFNTFQNGGAIAGVANVFLQVRGDFLSDRKSDYYDQSR